MQMLEKMYNKNKRFLRGVKMESLQVITQQALTYIVPIILGFVLLSFIIALPFCFIKKLMNNHR